MPEIVVPQSAAPTDASPSFQPTNIDLIDLETVKSWLGILSANTDADNILQFLITAFSQHVLNKTGVSTFNNVQSYIETYDGNGHNRMFLRNPPVAAVVSVVVGAQTLQASTGPTTPGWYVEDSQKSIALRGNLRFHQGMGNVIVSYTGGYDEVPSDLQEAALIAISQNYKRKDWQDLASASLSSGSGVSGTTRYRDWQYPPQVQNTIEYYKRRALV